jgi:predicted PhzF superfamily epimerase YddE/YHI9
VDFASRVFAPWAGIDEDPVTGVAHTSLAPYWCQAIGRNELRARQISERGGELTVRWEGDRVHLIGHAVQVAEGTMVLP